MWKMSIINEIFNVILQYAHKNLQKFKLCDLTVESPNAGKFPMKMSRNVDN